MSQHTFYIVLNVVFGLIGLVVLVGWIRHRKDDYGDIRQAEISEDFVASEELLEDVLAEQARMERGQRNY